MQKLIKAFENMMVAVTFAESGEYDAAHKLSIQDQLYGATAETVQLETKAVKA